MKQLLLFILLSISAVSFAQRAEYGKLTEKGKLTEYLSKHGDVIKAGDELILGKPYNTNTYVCFAFSSGPLLASKYSGLKLKVKHIKVTKFGILPHYKAFIVFEDGGNMGVCDYDLGFETGEIINPNAKPTREQAIAQLKETKDLLDLQVISQEEYDAKKAELTPFILK